MYKDDAHYFMDLDGQYYVTKISVAGIYETFLITDDIKAQLLKKDRRFRKFYNGINKKTRRRLKHNIK